jgi:hypothetical protein
MTDLQSTGVAIFSSTPERPPTWPSTRSLDACECPHGRWEAYSAIQLLPGPPAPPNAASALANLHAITGCTCTLGSAPGDVTATVALASQTNVAADVTIALVQVGPPSPASPFAIDGFGRLSVSQAGLLTVSASFSLVNDGVFAFGSLRLPDAAQPDLEAPSAQTVGLTDVDGHATALFAWSGPVAANTSVEIDLWNGSGLIQDVRGGSLSVTWSPNP